MLVSVCLKSGTLCHKRKKNTTLWQTNGQDLFPLHLPPILLPLPHLIFSLLHLKLSLELGDKENAMKRGDTQMKNRQYMQTFGTHQAMGRAEATLFKYVTSAQNPHLQHVQHPYTWHSCRGGWTSDSRKWRSLSEVCWLSHRLGQEDTTQVSCLLSTSVSSPFLPCLSWLHVRHKVS